MLVIQGTPITSTQAKQQVTYTDATWVFTIWNIIEGVSYPTLSKNPYTVILNASFVNGTPITSIQAKQSQTYIDAGWSLANSLDNVGIWNIQEDVSYPYHRNCGSSVLPLGTPLTTVKRVVIVTEDIYGSMQLNGEVWKYVKNVSITAPLSGTIEESAVYNYDGEIIEHEGKAYRYVGSGVRGLNSCGGYGYYTTATSRTIPFVTDYQNVANFYYTEVSSTIEARISTSSGITILPIYERASSTDPRFNISIPSGIGTFRLVDISSQEASPLRLCVQEGIMAVQKSGIVVDYRFTIKDIVTTKEYRVISNKIFQYDVDNVVLLHFGANTEVEAYELVNGTQVETPSIVHVQVGVEFTIDMSVYQVVASDHDIIELFGGYIYFAKTVV